MKEDSQFPPIDSELEARIVALTLGEASDFEREDLLRLIAERPELQAFQREVAGVHAMLDEIGSGEQSPADDQWQLSSERRRELLAAIDGESDVEPGPVFLAEVNRDTARSIKRNWLLVNLLKIAAGTIFAGFLGSVALSTRIAQRWVPSATDDAAVGAFIREFEVDEENEIEKYESSIPLGNQIQGPPVATNGLSLESDGWIESDYGLEIEASDLGYAGRSAGSSRSQSAPTVSSAVPAPRANSSKSSLSKIRASLEDLAAVADGAVVDGAVVDGAVVDGAVVDGAVVDGVMSDGGITEGLDRAESSSVRFGVDSKAKLMAPRYSVPSPDATRGWAFSPDGKMLSRESEVSRSAAEPTSPTESFKRDVLNMPALVELQDIERKRRSNREQPLVAKEGLVVPSMPSSTWGTHWYENATGNLGFRAATPGQVIADARESELRFDGGQQGGGAEASGEKRRSTAGSMFGGVAQNSAADAPASTRNPATPPLAPKSELRRHFGDAAPESESAPDPFDGSTPEQTAAPISAAPAKPAMPAPANPQPTSPNQPSSGLALGVGNGRASRGGQVKQDEFNIRGEAVEWDRKRVSGNQDGNQLSRRSSVEKAESKKLTEQEQIALLVTPRILIEEEEPLVSSINPRQSDDLYLRNADRWRDFSRPQSGSGQDQSDTGLAEGRTLQEQVQSGQVQRLFNQDQNARRQDNRSQSSEAILGRNALDKIQANIKGLADETQAASPMRAKQSQGLAQETQPLGEQTKDIASYQLKIENAEAELDLDVDDMAYSADGSIALEGMIRQESLPNQFGEVPEELFEDVTRGFRVKPSMGGKAQLGEGEMELGGAGGMGMGMGGRSAGRGMGVGGGADVNFLSKSLHRESARQEIPRSLDETSAEKESFSTFSLHVSDVSFKLARTALAAGQWPEADKIRVEEFVNAFDYGDPLPRQSERVTCRVEQSAHPFLQQRNLLRVSMRTAASGRASQTPLRLTLLLDNSGSMERVDREQTVRRAFATLAQQLKPIDQVTLISFARQPRLLADRVSGAQSQQLVQMVQDLPSEGGTNLETALNLAFEKAREQKVEGAQNRIVLLTDGAVNLGNANPDRLSKMVTVIRDAGIAFDAAGISADGLNDQILEALTRKGDGRYYLLDSAESVDDGFARQIAGALRPSAKNVKIQVEFNPDRVGRYKLLGFEKHRLKKEDFRDDNVDAAEMAGAETGVALYHFEAKPDGQGDVGFVSVRFHDVESGQMVENRWPIPYQTDAPALVQSAPSLQIASVAAALAMKLKGGPQSATIDLQTLSQLIAELPANQSQKPRVLELGQMIQQARQISGQ